MTQEQYMREMLADYRRLQLERGTNIGWQQIIVLMGSKYGYIFSHIYDFLTWLDNNPQ